MSFISYLINGISLGSVYALIALGYTMVYGIAKMLNFAHGDVIMVGAFITYTMCSTMGLSPVIGVLAAVVACTLLGMAIEKVAYKPLRKATSPLAVLITAIGVSYLLQNVALLIFGANAKAFTSVVSVPALKLADGQINITGETIVTIVSCLIIMAGLMLFINKTKAGQAMLAVSEDKGAAQLMGINVDGTIALTFAIGSGLAAVAGVIAPLFYMLIGGAVLGFTYKAINTMDSMVGYKNDKYQWFGTAAAKLDDVVNFIPARVSAVLMILAAYLTGMDGKNAARIFRRDRFNHKSPNSAQTEAVMAGALDVQLAGDAWYFGKLHKKPTIGDPVREMELLDIRRSHKLLYGTAMLGLILGIILRILVL